MCVKCAHMAKPHWSELMCTDWQSKLHVYSCLRAVMTCSRQCVYNKRPVCMPSYQPMHFHVSVSWPASTYVIVRFPCGLDYTQRHWETRWKPVKQAVSDQAWFVSLSAGCAHSLLRTSLLRTAGLACWGPLLLNLPITKNRETPTPFPWFQKEKKTRDSKRGR